MNLLEWLFQSGFILKRVATTNGGEYAGPCPFCGGRDRFRVWPEEDQGRFWCRGCGKSGDAIQFLRDFRWLSFKEACALMGVEPDHKAERKPFKPSAREMKEPPATWQARAKTFLERAQGPLKASRAALEWLRGRGLRDETINAAGLGWNPFDLWEPRQEWGLEPQQDEKGNVKKLWLPAGLVIPLRVARAVFRLRIRRPHGEPHYVIVSGSDMRPMNFNLDRKHLVIVESELDGLLIDQEAGDMAGVVALGSAQTKPDQELNRLLKMASRLLITLDFDGAGASAAWRYWLSNYPGSKRWPTPYGKDPSEAAQRGLNIGLWNQGQD